MMRVSKHRLFNFEELFTIASLLCVVLCVGSCSNTNYGNSLGKAPLIPAKLVFWVF